MKVLDLNNESITDPLSSDVCIVGAGAAGIAVAHSLIDSGLSVLLLESGAWSEEAASQALYEGVVADDKLHSPPDKYRVRRYGGSTTIWGGRCMPYDELDFQRRAWLKNSGWPIALDEVSKYYPAACELAEIGNASFCAEDIFPVVPEIIRGFSSPDINTSGLEKFSCPTDFGIRYKRRLMSAPNIRLLIHANCTHIQLNEAGDTVSTITVKSLSGRSVLVKSKQFVIATGGLETARLLLNSDDVICAGVGNEHDVVGRYYMCHIAGTVGDVRIDRPVFDVHHGYAQSSEGVYCRRRFSLTREAQEREQIGNLIARLHFPRISDPDHRSGILSGLYLAKDFISYEYGKRLNDGTDRTLVQLAKHVTNVVADAPTTTSFLWNWITKRTLAARKFPSVIIPNKSNRFTFDIHGEQEPNPDSRVTLVNDVDALGMRRLCVDWLYTSSDIHTVRRSLQVIGTEFRRLGIGDVSFSEDTLEAELVRFGAYGGHHIGTARMGSDPRTSVVNGNCRLHSVRNIYVAGSAVFPTSSQANPTLTIVAMAIRLGEFLKHQAGESYVQ